MTTGFRVASNNGGLVLSTVWHSGTAHALTILPDSTQSIHCCPEVLNREHLATTRRDPWKVAASWGNRYDMRHREIRRVWFEQWGAYPEVLRRAERIIDIADEKGIGHRPDSKNLHFALKSGDMAYFYQHVPRGMIEFALGAVGD